MKFNRWELIQDEGKGLPIGADQKEILKLASLAPSAHNMQPWAVKIIDNNHWIISTELSRWLPATDPMNRETFISLGAFSQSLICGAASLGYDAQIKTIAETAFDDDIMEVTLKKTKTIIGVLSILFIFSYINYYKRFLQL